MPGRHSAPQTASSSIGLAKYGVFAIVLILVLAGGVYAAQSALGSGCSDTSTYTLAADPAIADVVTQVVGEVPPEDMGCVSIDVTAAESSAGSVGADAPSLWIPDSSLWVGKLERSTGETVDLASPSVASSPAVIAARADEVPFFDTWLTALKLRGLRIGNPLSNTTSDAPILGALAEAGSDAEAVGAVEAALVPIAQAQAATRNESDAVARLDEVSADGGVAVVSEQTLVDYRSTGAELDATVPTSGSFYLDFPLAVTEPAAERVEGARAAGTALAGALASESGLAALSAAGFRAPDMSPLGVERGVDEGGVGEVGVGEVEALAVDDQEIAETALRRYQVLALPSRALVVEDVSGSMGYSAGADTRIELTVQANRTGIGLFPDNASMGLWAFSIGLGGGDRDYRELVPIRGLDEDVDGRSQRDVLLQQMGVLPGLVDGGTGLYDTTLAAFRKVKEGYDPGAINSVIVFTDGSNEDPGSISLDELLAALRAEQDPNAPVIVVTIGITEDADAGVLQQISAATGGSSYLARNPSEIPNVFVNALKARSGR